MKDFDFSYITSGTLGRYSAPSLQPNAMKFRLKASFETKFKKNATSMRSKELLSGLEMPYTLSFLCESHKKFVCLIGH
jgi:hypothetical protein